ncbi:MAG: hypothetical protein WBA20_13800 [Ketobacter sp.]
MAITAKSDQDIIKIVEPMINDVVSASNQMNWELFSKYQTNEEANDPENRKNVEKQWSESKFLTSLSLQREVLGVLRRDDMASVFWKQTSKDVAGEYLATYQIKDINQEIKEVGFLLI